MDKPPIDNQGDSTLDKLNSMPKEMAENLEEAFLDGEGNWVQGVGRFDIELKSKTVKSPLENLKDSIVDYFLTINGTSLEKYIKNNNWGALHDNDVTDSPITITGECKSPSLYKIHISNVLNEIVKQIKIEINSLGAKYDKLTFINNELQWAKKTLVGFGYPITTDYFGNFQMDKSGEIPAKYKMAAFWTGASILTEDAVFMIEQVYVPKIIEIKFNAIAEYAIFLKNQIEIIHGLNTPAYAPQDLDIKIDTVERPVIQLPETFNLPKLDLKVNKLDIRQTALLFHLLKKQGIILEYSVESLAKIVYTLTGYSEQNLRTKSGFGIIGDILRDTPETKSSIAQNILNYNLLEVKAKLEDIIAYLDIQMQKNADKLKG